MRRAQRRARKRRRRGRDSGPTRRCDSWGDGKRSGAPRNLRYVAGMTPFVDGVWLDSDPVRIVGMRLTATMALLRLGGDELVAYSPVSLTPERRAAVEALGRVAHVYAPSLFHERWA